MNFIKKYIEGKNHRWVWFGSTLVAGAIPLFISIGMKLNKGISFEGEWWEIAFYSLADLSFLGLSMNMSNFNLLGNKEFSVKDSLVAWSLLLLVGISICLGHLYSDDGQNPGLLFRLVLHVMVGVSIFWSHTINVYVFEEINAKGKKRKKK